MKFKIHDIVTKKNIRHDKGCVVIEMSTTWDHIRGDYTTRCYILDYDRNVKTWVNEAEIDIFTREVRDRKLKELGI